jgi:hypothetical protein
MISRGTAFRTWSAIRQLPIDMPGLTRHAPGEIVAGAAVRMSGTAARFLGQSWFRTQGDFFGRSTLAAAEGRSPSPCLCQITFVNRTRFSQMSGFAPRTRKRVLR